MSSKSINITTGFTEILPCKQSHLMTLRASFFSWCILIFGAMITTTASAIPALQLGPDGDSAWSYDSGTQTWVYSDGSSFNLNAYANATTADGGHGDYAWDTAGATDQYAYLVAASMPDLGDIDGFDILVSGASLFSSGYGTPLVTDSNSLAPHGIYETYFEIYEFQFDGSLGLISDTQPGETGTGQGYTEGIGIDVISMIDGLSGIHFDLFTVTGERWNLSDDFAAVEAFAPFSHDAQVVPIPAAVWLFGSGLLGLIGVARRKA